MKRFEGGYVRLVVTIALCAAISAAGCRKSQDAAKKEEGPLPVRVAPVVRKDMPVQINTFGNVEAHSSVQVKAQVAGELMEILFTEGQEVKQGDVIFKINPRTFESSLKQAQAALTRDAALSNNAHKEAERANNLFKQGVYTQEQYENAKAADEAQAAAVIADSAAIENAKLMLSYCTIRAPMDGRTGSRLVDPGNLVKANDSQALVLINQVHPIFISFSVPEQQLANIRKFMATSRMEVRAVIPGHENEPAAGAVTFIDNAVDPATGMIKVKASFPNAESRLWPGQFVNVAVTLTTEPNALLVPTVAVQTGQQGQFVFVLKEDKTVESRPVVIGRVVGEETVVEKGVSAGEQVVTDGQLRLLPGAKVEVVEDSQKEPERVGG